jgi:uncharacterized protein YjbI with pentapeptide repeats
MSTEDTFVAPSLSSVEQKVLNRAQLTRWKKFVNWLGFRGYDKLTWEYDPDGTLQKVTLDHVRGKTFVDWITLLVSAVGIFVVVASFYSLYLNVHQFNLQQASDQTKTQAQNQANLQQQKAQFQNLQDQQHQTILDNYIDRMSDLLVNQNLATTKSVEVQAIARARTFVALRNVDAKRRGTIIGFLWEANLINGPHPIIPLNTAYLAFMNINSTYLNGVNFSGGLVSFADLNNCDLDGAILTNASLDHVDLRNTSLRNANLKGANLTGALFNSDTILTGAIMPNGSKHP